jgi:hypothetical protein
MTDHDVFETRLHSAVRAYVGGVSSDLDPVAFAARVAREHPRHRHLAIAWPARPTWSRQTAWVAVAAAALLALAGALVVASGAFRPTDRPAIVPAPALVDARCPAGTDPDTAGPADAPRPPLGWFTPAFDAESGTVVALVLPRSTMTLELWTFDVCTNAWARPAGALPGELARSSVDAVYDPSVDRVIVVGETGETWTYDTNADAWRERTQAPSPLDFVPAPDHNTGDLAQKRLVYDAAAREVVMLAPLEAPRAFAYHAADDEWTELPRPTAAAGARSDRAPYVTVAAYDPSLDRIILLDGTDGWAARLLDVRTGTWEDLATNASPWSGNAWGRFDTASALETATGTLMTTNDNLTTAFRAAAGTWETLGNTPHNWTGHVLVGDTVNGRLLLFGGTYRTETAETFDSDGVWAFDARTLAWTELLAPSARTDPASSTAPVTSPGVAPATGPAALVEDAACPAGSTPDVPGPATGDRPDTLKMDMAYDRGSAKVVALAFGDDFTSWTPWVLDVCTNTWSRASLPEHGSDARSIAYDAVADRVVVFGRSGSVQRYDVDSDRWTDGSAWPGDEQDVNSTYAATTNLAVFDRALGRIVVLYGRVNPQVWTYDTAADAWAFVPSVGDDPTEQLATGIPMGYSEASYDPLIDRVIVVAAEQPGGHGMAVDPRTGRWERLPWTMGESGVGWGDTGAQMAFDESIGQTVLVSGGYVNAYDGAARRWTALATGSSDAADPLHRFMHGLAYDAANRRLVLAGGEFTGGGVELRADDAWALDVATMTSTQIVPTTATQQYDNEGNTWGPVQPVPTPTRTR